MSYLSIGQNDDYVLPYPGGRLEIGPHGQPYESLGRSPFAIAKEKFPPVKPRVSTRPPTRRRPTTPGRTTRVTTQPTGRGPKPPCTPPMIPGGYVFDERLGKGKGFWRRGTASECGLKAPPGAKKRVHNKDGTVTQSEERDGQWVQTGTVPTKERKECLDAGVPEPFLTECFNLRRKGMPMQEVIDTLQGRAETSPDLQGACTNAGIPPELIDECGVLLQQGVPIEQIAAAVQQEQAAAEAAATRKFPTALVAAAGGGALLLLLLLRRKR